jgi:YggT family protein
MDPFSWLIIQVIDLFVLVIIITAVLSWLIAFNVLNPRNPIVGRIWDILVRLTEPALAPIRRILPNLGGIDISPVILILLLMFLKKLVLWVGGY